MICTFVKTNKDIRKKKSDKGQGHNNSDSSELINYDIPESAETVAQLMRRFDASEAQFL